MTTTIVAIANTSTTSASTHLEVERGVRFAGAVEVDGGAGGAERILGVALVEAVILVRHILNHKHTLVRHQPVHQLYREKIRYKYVPFSSVLMHIGESTSFTRFLRCYTYGLLQLT